MNFVNICQSRVAAGQEMVDRVGPVSRRGTVAHAVKALAAYIHRLQRTFKCSKATLDAAVESVSK